VFIGSVAQAGGVDNTIAFLQSIPGFLSGTEIAAPIVNDAGQQVVEGGQALFGPAGEYGIIAIVSCLAWGLGYFGMPQVLVRFMSISHSDEIKKSRVIAMVWVVISLGCAVCIGLIGRAVMPTEFLTQSAAENVFIVLSQMILPAFVCGLVVSGILAASMSSSSAYMIISSSAVAQNIFKGLFKKDASDRQIMIVARLTMVVILIFGIFIALDENSSIFMVVSYAWAGFGASFGPLVLLSLYWRRTNLPGALAGMITGAGTVLIWHELIRPFGGVWGVYELLPAFILGFIAIVVVSKLTKEPSKEITKTFDTYMDADV
jgi:sodium/proline symporter